MTIMLQIYARLSFIETLYTAIITFSVRIVEAYVYADTPYNEGDDITDIPKMMLLSAPSATTLPVLESVVHSEAVSMPIRMYGMVMYTKSVHVPIFKDPTIAYDTQIATVPFGSMVMAHEPQGRFYNVTWNAIQGWMLRDDLAERAVDIFPHFVENEENLVDSKNTALVRALIGDPFGLSRSTLSLQAGEYVLYRLWRRSVLIPWNDVRPRVPGSWHTILRGITNVHIHIAPKVGTIMEYMLDAEIGHVAYVEAVFPDETICISEVNNPDFGMYHEKELSKAMWKEYRPVFIEII